MMVQRPPQRQLDTGGVAAGELLGVANGDLPFADRRDAGRRLATVLRGYRYENPVVVGIPRGGVAVAAEVARALHAPLEIIVVSKICAPAQPDETIGALAEAGVSVIDEDAVGRLGIAAAQLDEQTTVAERELRSRLERYYGANRRLSIAGRTVVLVDDGLATGTSARAAATSLRQSGAARVILAVPVAAPGAAHAIGDRIDEVVCLAMPASFWTIGAWYEDFSPTSDAEVAALLCEHSGAAARAVSIATDTGQRLRGDLRVPWGAYGRGAVVLAG